MVDSKARLINIKSNRERGMDRIVRLLWVIVVLLVILIAKESTCYCTNERKH